MPPTLVIAKLAWVYMAGAIALTATGLALAAWALFWDRARGRLRCPKCWYDLSAGANAAGGAPSVPPTCPECGKSITREGQMRRTRRRWRLVPVALVLLLVAYELPRIPAIRDRGYAAAIPTTALILIAPLNQTDLFQVWTSYQPPGALIKELERDRLDARSAWQWQHGLWTLRLRLRARLDGADRIPRSLRSNTEALRNTTILIPEASSRPTDLVRTVADAAGVPITFHPDERSVDPHLVPPGIERFAGTHISGPDLLWLLTSPRRYWTVTDSGLHVGPPEPLLPDAQPSAIRFYPVADLARLGRWRHDIPPPSEHEGVIFDGGSSLLPDRPIWVLIDILQSCVAEDSWRDNGGDHGLVFAHDNRSLIIKTHPLIHLEIERFLASLRKPVGIETVWPQGVDADTLVDRYSPYVALGAGPFGTHMPFSRTLVYDCRPLLLSLPKGNRTLKRFWDIRDRLLAEVAPETWRDNGGDAKCLPLGDRLVVQAPASIHTEIQRFLHAELARSASP